MNSWIAKLLAALVSSVLMGILIGPGHWYVRHGADPLLSSGAASALSLVPCLLVGLAFGRFGSGFLSSAGFLVTSILVVFSIFGYRRVLFFCDSDLGCGFITALNMITAILPVLIGIWIGNWIRLRSDA